MGIEKMRKGASGMVLTENKAYTVKDVYNLPDGTRAELIDGQIFYMDPPSRKHQRIVTELATAINTYLKKNRGSCEVNVAPFAVFLNKDDRNYVEPDISVVCDKDKLNEKGCSGAPDWIMEIVSPSTASHDYIYKLNLYAKAGVREYWVVDPIEKSIYVYFLEKDRFKAKSYTFQDKIKANIYQDLWINFAELSL